MPQEVERLEPRYVCFQSPYFFIQQAFSFCPFISSTAAYPMAMAFASTFLCSQEIHGLAPMIDAYLREKNKGHIVPEP